MKLAVILLVSLVLAFVLSPTSDFLTACGPSPREAISRLQKSKLEQVVQERIVAKAEQKGVASLGFTEDGFTTITGLLRTELLHAVGDEHGTFVAVCREGKFVGLKIVVGRGKFVNYSPERIFSKMTPLNPEAEVQSHHDGRWCYSYYPDT